VNKQKQIRTNNASLRSGWHLDLAPDEGAAIYCQ